MIAEEVLLLPRGTDRAELIDGVLHRRPLAEIREAIISSRVAYILTAFVKKHPCGIILAAGTGYILHRNPDTVRAPDASFVSTATLNRAGLPSCGYFVGAPDLAVEVLSPDDRRADVDQRTHDWFAAGTQVVWNIDPQQRTVTVYHMPDEFRVLTESDTLEGSPLLPGFVCPLKDVFDQTV